MSSREEIITGDAIILTEGPTDWRHLKKAQEKLGISLNIEFYEKEEELNGDELLNACKAASKHPQSNPVPLIFVFDRDVKRIINKVSGKLLFRVNLT